MMKRIANVAATMMLTAVTWSFDGVAAHASDTARVCERHFSEASQKYSVPLPVLYAVGLTESGKKGVLSPYALNIEGQSAFPASVEIALARLTDELARGKTLIDVGCMQINHHYHRDQFGSDRQMFNPRNNVLYAAKFLNILKKKHKTWEMAIARYHAGPNNDKAQKAYVCRVIASMVSAGMGKWTPQAKAFCK